MHRIVLISALLLTASPSAADREPYYYPQTPYQPEPYVDPDYDGSRWHERDRYDAWERRDRHPGRWQSLAGYANAREGVTHIRLPPYLWMSRIRIEGTHGAPVISMIEIFYDRHVQRARVDRRLLRGQGIDVRVDPRRHVRSIIVHTDPRYRGGYSVWGG